MSVSNVQTSNKFFKNMDIGNIIGIAGAIVAIFAAFATAITFIFKSSAKVQISDNTHDLKLEEARATISSNELRITAVETAAKNLELKLAEISPDIQRIKADMQNIGVSINALNNEFAKNRNTFEQMIANNNRLFEKIITSNQIMIEKNTEAINRAVVVLEKKGGG
jgi:septal ring factor EnvC (AmiA/AmiB activator)